MEPRAACPKCSTPVIAQDPACPHCGTALWATSGVPLPPGPDVPPDLPPRYEVKQLLGRGGMGRVFLCRDAVLDVEVAVKVLPSQIADDPKSLARIEAEARVSARLRGCPGILNLYGFEHHRDTRFLVMEYAAGGSLFDRLRDQGRLPEAGCRRVGAEVAEALAFAHGLGVLHRDIKPGNVLLDIQGRIKVADFGLARVVQGAYAHSTQAPVEGTPVYMPPEAIRRQGVDGRSDLYSLGAMLYELATGNPPFRGSFAEIAMMKVGPGASAPDPREARPELSADFSAIVRRLLDTEPSKRFAGAAACAQALRAGDPAGIRSAAAALPATPAPLPPATAVPVLRPAAVRRSSTGWVPWAVGALLLAAAGAWAIRPSGAPPPVPPVTGPGPGPSVAPPAPLPKTAGDALVVVTRPAGAEVFVDGRSVGVTASDEGLRLPDVAPGVPHRVSARLADHEPDEESGVVWNRGEPRAPVVLKLMPKQGFLELEGGPPGAAVSIRRGGKLVRESVLREDGRMAAEMLEAGDYEVEATLDTWVPWRKGVRVGAGRSAPVRVEMAMKDGLLAVASVPPGATVVLDGRAVGTTPLEGLALRPGAHPLALEHPEASRWAGTAQVAAEKTTDLGVIELSPLAALDLGGLPEGVAASIEGAPATGVLRRQPGPVMLSLVKQGCRPQSLEMNLKPGPNALPALHPWTAIPGRLDLSGLPSDVTLVATGGQILRPPFSAFDVPPGLHHVSLVRSGFLPSSLRIAVRSGETSKVPAPEFRAPEPPRGEPDPVRAAVDAGIDWLRRHQGPSGSWDCDGFESMCQKNKCGGPGVATHDAGVTGLAVLALLQQRSLPGGAWNGAAAWRGLDWLLGSQIPDGKTEGCYGGADAGHFVYCHAIATLAVVEGFRATGSPLLRASAQRGVDLILRAQNPYLGWRYGIQTADNDTSVTVWMIEALKSAQEAGLRVDASAFDGALAWVEKMTDPETGRTGYFHRGEATARLGEMLDRFPPGKSEAMTAAGLVTRFACGEPRDGDLARKGIDLCLAIPPNWSANEGTIDFYYWNLGTQAVFAAGGDAWKRWDAALRKALLDNQVADRKDDRFGSWDPADAWAPEGGRIYSTAMNVLSLEVPYRGSLAFRDEPERTAVSLLSDPPGAQVFLDGRFLGLTPLKRATAPAGALTLRVVHPETADYVAEVSAAPFQVTDLGSVALAPGATLDPADLPRDAVVAVQGREVKGKTAIRAGTSRVLALRTGSFTQILQVEADSGGTVRPAAGPWKPAPEWGRAILRGLPAPPEAGLAGVTTSPGFLVQDGRIYCEKDRVEMVLVPAGPGRVGAPGAPAFLLDRHEVTAGQFQAFCKDTKREPPGPQPGSSSRHPAMVAHHVALAYAAWAGKRLPTREEWERGAFGRSPVMGGPQPLPFPWGDWDSPRARNLAGRDDGQTGLAPVGWYPLGMSPCGALDMVGNAAEWLEDGFFAGGSWTTPPTEAVGLGFGPAPGVGFRCVADLPVK